MLIFLIGYMGSGKTGLGRELARSLGYRFLDLDELFEKKMSSSIPDFFEKEGEEAFRKEEHKLLKSLLQEKDTVIAAGGGTPCFYDNMEMMNRAGVTVYLRVNVDELYERLKGEAQSRPILRDVISGNLKQFISNSLAEREGFYRQAKTEFNPVISDINELIKEF